MKNSNQAVLQRPTKTGLLRSLVNQLIYFYYGNTAGLRNNIGAKSELKNFRKFYVRHNKPLHCSKKAKEDATHLIDQGYVLINNLIETDNINQAVQKTQQIFDDPKLHVTEKNGAMLHAINPSSYNEYKNLFNDHLKETLYSYYKCAYRIQSIRVWRNLHVGSVDENKDDVFSNTFHNDACKATSLRIFILLKDGVNKKTGAFRFHNKLMSKRLLRSNYFSRYKQNNKLIDKLIDPTSINYFEGDAGDCAIVNTQECLHAASIPEFNSYRDILQFEVYVDGGPIKTNEKLFDIPDDHEILSLIK